MKFQSALGLEAFLYGLLIILILPFIVSLSTKFPQDMPAHVCFLWDNSAIFRLVID